MPYSIRVLLENLERHRLCGEPGLVDAADVAAMAQWEGHIGRGVPLFVERVILPDSSGLPVLQDLAALRDAVAQAGGDVRVVRPRVPVDLIVDHSLQVDRAGSPEAIAFNIKREFERNGERYRFLKWAQQALAPLRVFGPGTGIIHQVNLEFIAQVVMHTAPGGDTVMAFPEFVIGADSHTPMVGGLGVLGWGVGGLDAEAALLGLAYVFSVPEVVGLRLTGTLSAGVTATDVVLHLTQRLRKERVVGAIVEYFGPAVAGLSVPDRATLTNMAPEYGATTGYFPVDARTIDFIGTTRSAAQAHRVEAYCRANDLYRAAEDAPPRYLRVIDVDLGEVELSLAGPQRPQDRMPLSAVGADFRRRLRMPLSAGGFAAKEPTPPRIGNTAPALGHGSVVIAAITSCTNTSNPTVMVSAGLLARNALRMGLRVPHYVKTSLAPGSRAVTRYLREAGLLAPLEALGFHVIGYGCTTCSGKSGPLDAEISSRIEGTGLVAVAVLSGNRNFEGRIHRLVRASYIGSPPLVLAYALAGRIDLDLTREPISQTAQGRPVFLSEIWPKDEEVESVVGAIDPSVYAAVYAQPPEDAGQWQALPLAAGDRYCWDSDSNYLVSPPFLAHASRQELPDHLRGARVLAAFGDSVTTDHISPSGEIPSDSPAGRYLRSLGITPEKFNTYVARRCNHEVMTRATFANVRIKNQLVPGIEGGVTCMAAEAQPLPIFDAAAEYRRAGTPMVVLAGQEYGTGSSRDWAAKGPALLGVRAVIAEGYERIHRANLVGMGIVPLQFGDGQGWRRLGLTGFESFDIEDLGRGVREGRPVTVAAAAASGHVTRFVVWPQVFTESERRMLVDGGMLPTVLHRMLEPSSRDAEQETS